MQFTIAILAARMGRTQLHQSAIRFCIAGREVTHAFQKMVILNTERCANKRSFRKEVEHCSRNKNLIISTL